MPTTAASAWAASASVGWIIGWLSSISRSSGEGEVTGSIGKERTLIRSAMVKMTLWKAAEPSGEMLQVSETTLCCGQSSRGVRLER
jgi:hypothetical protein